MCDLGIRFKRRKTCQPSCHPFFLEWGCCRAPPALYHPLRDKRPNRLHLPFLPLSHRPWPLNSTIPSKIPKKGYTKIIPEFHNPITERLPKLVYTKISLQRNLTPTISPLNSSEFSAEFVDLTFCDSTIFHSL